MREAEYALRGQKVDPDRLEDFWYRTYFHISQEELEQEDSAVYHYNLAIIYKIRELQNEVTRNKGNEIRRNK